MLESFAGIWQVFKKLMNERQVIDIQDFSILLNITI